MLVALSNISTENLNIPFVIPFHVNTMRLDDVPPSTDGEQFGINPQSLKQIMQLVRMALHRRVYRKVARSCLVTYAQS